MANYADNVYALPVAGRWLVYAPLNGITALLNTPAIHQLQKISLDGEEPMAELARMLAFPSGSPPVPRRGPLRPLFLGFVPTRACNLRCAYCAFHVSEDAGSMLDVGLAVEAVDWMAGYAQAMQMEKLEVHFFGGEPLIATDFLDVVVHRIRMAAAERGLCPHLEASSNGVISEQRALWIGDYFDTVVLSFDGFREPHNRHRPHADGRGSFDEVARTARILSHSSIELCLRICVTAENVRSLVDSVRWFCEEFRPDFIDVETLQPTDLSYSAGLMPPDPYDFAAAFWQARHLAEAQGVRVIYSPWPDGELRTSFCPVGKDALIVTPDGRISACYLDEHEWKVRGMDMTLGRVERGHGVLMDMDAVDRVRNLGPDHPRCQHCFCRWTCAGGCHVNHSYPGCPDNYDSYCIQTRLISMSFILEAMGKDKLAESLVTNRQAAMLLAGNREVLACGT